MLLPLLITIPALLASSGAASDPVVGFAQAVQEMSADERATLRAFDLAVGDYVALERRLARRMPLLLVTADPVQLREAIDSLALAIRTERPDARAGDIFTPPVASVFRVRIERALHHLDTLALLLEMEEDSQPGARTPIVNGPFPWEVGNAIWPSVLCALPALPEELEYRFIGADLVLVDIRANLVVDVLKDALPRR